MDYRLHTTPTAQEKTQVIIDFLAEDGAIVLKTWDTLIPVYIKMINTASGWNLADKEKYGRGIEFFNAASQSIGDIEKFYEAVVKFLFWKKDNLK